MAAGSEIEALEKEFAARKASAMKELRAKYGEAVESAFKPMSRFQTARKPTLTP